MYPSVEGRNNGGEGGIRTHGTLRFNGFQDRRFRPLSHLSSKHAIIYEMTRLTTAPVLCLATSRKALAFIFTLLLNARPARTLRGFMLAA
jgi:hypothetical protein